MLKTHQEETLSWQMAVWGKVDSACKELRVFLQKEHV